MAAPPFLWVYVVYAVATITLVVASLTKLAWDRELDQRESAAPPARAG